jgi:uncharacterized protein (DUF302 family)
LCSDPTNANLFTKSSKKPLDKVIADLTDTINKNGFSVLKVGFTLP